MASIIAAINDLKLKEQADRVSQEASSLVERLHELMSEIDDLTNCIEHTSAALSKNPLKEDAIATLNGLRGSIQERIDAFEKSDDKVRDILQLNGGSVVDDWQDIVDAEYGGLSSRWNSHIRAFEKRLKLFQKLISGINTAVAREKSIKVQALLVRLNAFRDKLIVSKNEALAFKEIRKGRRELEKGLSEFGVSETVIKFYELADSDDGAVLSMYTDEVREFFEKHDLIGSMKVYL